MQGDNFIQLEGRGLHNINSHVAHTIGDDNDQPPDLLDNSDEDDDFNDDEDQDSEDKDDSNDKDDCEKSSENSSDGIQSICFLLQK